MTRRPGDLPDGGDKRPKNMEQVVLKPQNLPEQLRLLEDSPPTQGRPSIPDLMTNAYQTYPLPRKILEAIGMNSGQEGIRVTECTEETGQLRYRGSLYVPDSDELRLPSIQEHHDTALAGHPGWAKMFDLLDRGWYWKDMRKDVN